MPQEVRTRPQAKQITFSPNNKVSVSLGRGMVYRELAVRLQGQLAVAAVDNTAAKTLAGDEWAAVKKIEVIANGNDVLKTYSGNALWWFNYTQYGVPPRITPTIGDAATLNPSFDVVLILPFWMPRSISPMDTALDARTLSSLEVAVTWGDYADLNASATGWTSTPTVDIWSLESFNIDGPFSVWRIAPIEKTITAKTSRLQIQLPVGRMFRSFLINTTDAGVDVSTILNNIKIVSGSTVFSDIQCGNTVLQQWQHIRAGISRPFDDGAAAYDDLRRGDANDVDGWYDLDLVTDGFLSEALDSLGFSELILECDVNVGVGTTKLTVYPSEITPIRANVS